ncbi:MAG: GNAT family N-acetyltransferase [Alphaproteobacteria bacterium]|nr:GNAT family N-acetyltransferase [Alphaproteobacteria bacterium]
MVDNIIVRSAKPEDFKAVQEVQLTGGDDVLTYGAAIEIADMEMHAANPKAIFGVAEVDGQVIGFIYGEQLVARWAMFSYLVVKPKYRSMGVVRKLGEWSISLCKARGLKYLLCYVDKDRPKLINFYKHFGFEASPGEYVEMIKKLDW